MLKEFDSLMAGLTPEDVLAIDRDAPKAARSVRLRYVTDSIEGVTRVKKGKGFCYYFRGAPVADQQTLKRIRSLVIPPAWTRVWICPYDNGHLQATGYDIRGRKQYRYHPLWSSVRNETKFHRLYEFGKALPALREQLEKDLAKNDLSREHVIAAVIGVMQRTYIRVGNQDYEKRYGSYGVTTLKDKHVTINGSSIRFSFTGKKGISQTVTLRHRKLARVIKQCRDIPGKELFQYYDKDGSRCAVDSGMVNEYIRQAMTADFTAKDFRTWAGSLNLLRALKSLGQAVTVTDCKKNIIDALDQVSRLLGNTRAVCKKYYVHPGLLMLYEQNNLNRYLKDLDEAEEPEKKGILTEDERILMKVLYFLQRMKE